jgi:hypothetical protein
VGLSIQDADVLQYSVATGGLRESLLHIDALHFSKNKFLVANELQTIDVSLKC